MTKRQFCQTSLLLALILILDTTVAVGAPSFSADRTPLEDEIKCYSIPYGAIGFAQHISTYYKLFILYKIREPLRPWKKLKGDSWKIFNNLLSGTQLLVNGIISAVTISRCNRSWELILMVVWKFMFAVTLAIWTFQANHIAARYKERDRDMPLLQGQGYKSVAESTEWEDTSSSRYEPLRDQGEEQEAKQVVKPKRVSLWWLLLYCAAVIIGLPGLFNLVHQNYHKHLVWVVTVVFCSAVGGVVGLFTLFVFLGGTTLVDRIKVGMYSILLIMPPSIMLVAALYSDWVLGVMVNNIKGIPVGKLTSVLYWIYFAAKELPLLTQ